MIRIDNPAIRPSVDQSVADRSRPKRGTPHGDAFMGNCALPSCQGRIVRADAFIVTQAKDLYHTGCWAQVKCRDLSRRPRRS